MASLHAVVGIPKHGPGAHPDNLVMALDGRGKNKIAPKGELDPAEHHGSLFWVVGRSSSPLDCNLILEDVCFEVQMSASLPAPKKAQNRGLLFRYLHDAFSAYPSEQETDPEEHPAPGLSA